MSRHPGCWLSRVKVPEGSKQPERLAGPPPPRPDLQALLWGCQGIAQFELGFVSIPAVVVCFLGGADLGTMPQTRWEGLE